MVKIVEGEQKWPNKAEIQRGSACPMGQRTQPQEEGSINQDYPLKT
jgi:hypothetical protein